ncbi:unnamed protein product [marine sediment metagenome]|uniref:Uncharacterized protein n=1 Tax=marine sediment metagenome TaxID=412755 RepID=X0YJ76_9ZZZZ
MLDKNGVEIKDGCILMISGEGDYYMSEVFVLFKRGKFIRLEKAEDITEFICSEVVEVVG